MGGKIFKAALGSGRHTFAAGNTLIMRSPEGEWVKVDPDDH